MSLSDERIEHYPSGWWIHEQRVKEAIKDLKNNFCGENHIGKEINEKIINEIFGEKLI